MAQSENRDVLAEKLRDLSEGDEVILKFANTEVEAVVDDISDKSETGRPGGPYYRNGTVIDRRVRFVSNTGSFTASCFWWPNHDDDDLQMDGGLQVGDHPNFDLRAYSFEMEKK